MDGLSADQRMVMESLGSGVSVVETAKTSGVSRAAIYKWIKDDPAFAAAYNQWQESLKESCRARMKMLLDKAANALEKALDGGDVKAALAVLGKTGMLEAEGEKNTDAEEVRREAVVAKKNREAKLKRKETYAGTSLR